MVQLTNNWQIMYIVYYTTSSVVKIIYICGYYPEYPSATNTIFHDDDDDDVVCWLTERGALDTAEVLSSMAALCQLQPFDDDHRDTGQICDDDDDDDGDDDDDDDDDDDHHDRANMWHRRWYSCNGGGLR